MVSAREAELVSVHEIADAAVFCTAACCRGLQESMGTERGGPTSGEPHPSAGW